MTKAQRPKRIMNTPHLAPGLHRARRQEGARPQRLPRPAADPTRKGPTMSRGMAEDEDFYEGIPLYIWKQAALVEDLRALTSPVQRAVWVAEHPNWADLLDAWSIVAAHVASTTPDLQGEAAA